jgi:hypothetical protein
MRHLEFVGCIYVLRQLLNVESIGTSTSWFHEFRYIKLIASWCVWNYIIKGVLRFRNHWVLRTRRFSRQMYVAWWSCSYHACALWPDARWTLHNQYVWGNWLLHRRTFSTGISLLWQTILWDDRRRPGAGSFTALSFGLPQLSGSSLRMRQRFDESYVTPR